ncbi:MAG TPA: patatin-like phospholipase family protein [Bacillota bacterium]|nr:patatin-like phospholipase family protein [Bacillota bacterium]HPF42488.1 patatin-like phospholipase family protein [Bacillota bacterium]HPJ85847.1 patatin-like phospholipase family protein [Bacillota bacterium]HPQ62141.1 patatin-like phospholipase family protein [Bacillota bacterium]HRX91647.1 patatin-like phospholipase family protein [Candidatus Izemoplasmatales bacterium]
MGKLGLCLSGGGAKGSYQIGAAMVLKEQGIFDRIDAFSGTSIGAANVCLLASTSVEAARDLWLSMPDNALERNRTRGHASSLKEKFNMIDHGLFKIDPLEDLLLASVDQKRLNEREVYVTVSELESEDSGFAAFLRMGFRRYLHDDSKAFYLPLREMSDNERLKAVVASCSIPVIFPAVIAADDKKYYDGGVYDGVPIKPLAEAGCDTIIIIRLNPRAPYHPELYPGIRFYDIIHKTSIGSPLDFTVDHVKELYQLGYNDMSDYLKTLYVQP